MDCAACPCNRLQHGMCFHIWVGTLLAYPLHPPNKLLYDTSSIIYPYLFYPCLKPLFKHVQEHHVCNPFWWIRHTSSTSLAAQVRFIDIRGTSCCCLWPAEFKSPAGSSLVTMLEVWIC